MRKSVLITGFIVFCFIQGNSQSHQRAPLIELAHYFWINPHENKDWEPIFTMFAIIDSSLTCKAMIVDDFLTPDKKTYSTLVLDSSFLVEIFNEVNQIHHDTSLYQEKLLLYDGGEFLLISSINEDIKIKFQRKPEVNQSFVSFYFALRDALLMNGDYDSSNVTYVNARMDQIKQFVKELDYSTLPPLGQEKVKFVPPVIVEDTMINQGWVRGEYVKDK